MKDNNKFHLSFDFVFFITRSESVIFEYVDGSRLLTTFGDLKILSRDWKSFSKLGNLEKYLKV